MQTITVTNKNQNKKCNRLMSKKRHEGRENHADTVQARIMSAREVSPTQSKGNTYGDNSYVYLPALTDRHIQANKNRKREKKKKKKH